MKYYKNETGQIFGYNENQTPKEGLIELTAIEVDELLNPVMSPSELLLLAIDEAKNYLINTDHKFYGDYELKANEDLEAIRLLRSEKRSFIRSNLGAN